MPSRKSRQLSLHWPVQCGILAVAVLLCGQSDSLAHVKWASREESALVSLEDSAAIVRFSFINDSTVPIRIAEITTSCTCTSAKADQEVYNPGANGVIVAELPVHDDLRPVQARLMVRTTNGADESRHMLVATATPEMPVTVSNPSIEWLVREAAETKVVELRSSTVSPVSVISVEDSKAVVTWSLVEIVPGRRYRLELEPKDISRSASTTLRVLLQVSLGESQIRKVLTVPIKVSYGI